MHFKKKKKKTKAATANLVRNLFRSPLLMYVTSIMIGSDSVQTPRSHSTLS